MPVKLRSKQKERILEAIQDGQVVTFPFFQYIHKTVNEKQSTP